MDKLRTKVQNADWWEITYLIIYGAIFTYEFLGTTMFEIKWPPRFGYIFLAASALYTIAKFIWHNTYTKKEMILSAIILFAFIMPAILTDYSFLWYVGFLIVGAKDVDFDKILKVYLTIGITIMLAAFAASQMGWIENLVYESWNRDERYSYGIIYPTDFAAHVFYLALAGIGLSEDKITKGRILNFIILAVILYDKCEARTSVICLMLMSMDLIFIKGLKNKLKKPYIYYLVNFSTLGFASFFICLTHFYNASTKWMYDFDGLISGRLTISSKALETYSYQLFGQNITEIGLGGKAEYVENYFFLDDSYIRILLLYGICLFVVTMFVIFWSGLRAIKAKKLILLFAIAIIGLHSFMEHHLLELAYNPFILLCFAQICNTTEKTGGT